MFAIGGSTPRDFDLVPHLNHFFVFSNDSKLHTLKNRPQIDANTKMACRNSHSERH